MKNRLKVRAMIDLTQLFNWERWLIEKTINSNYTNNFTIIDNILKIHRNTF